MGWLIAGLFASTFAAIVLGVHALQRDSARLALLALRHAAAQFDLQQASRIGWSGARVFCGTARGFDLRWTLTPQRVGRVIKVSVSHTNLTGRRLSPASRAEFPIGAELTLDKGVLTLTFKDTLGDDASELVPSTTRLLALATRLCDD